MSEISEIVESPADHDAAAREIALSIGDAVDECLREEEHPVRVEAEIRVESVDNGGRSA